MTAQIARHPIYPLLVARCSARLFIDGHPNGMAQDVVTGFLNNDNQARGRPVGVAIDKTGALLIADDVRRNTVWRVTSAAQT